MSSNPSKPVDQAVHSPDLSGQFQEAPFHPPAAAAAAPISTSDLVLDVGNMKSIMEFAHFMASGRSTVPDHLKGNPADCAAIVMKGIQWRMDPYAIAAKTYFVGGKLGYEGQLIAAAIVASGVTYDRPNYEWFGPWEKIIGKFDIKRVEAKGKPGEKDYKKAYEYRVPGWKMEDEIGLGIRVSATLKGETEPRVLELLLSQAAVRNSTLWASDPKQQLSYLGIARWARLHCPDVILGVYTPDELAPPEGQMIDINEPLPKNAKPADYANRKRNAQPAGPSEALLAKARAAADKGSEHFRAWWKQQPVKDRDILRGEYLAEFQATATAADNRTVEAPAPSPAPAAAPQATQADIDDFVAGMDRAGGYVPE